MGGGAGRGRERERGGREWGTEKERGGSGTWTQAVPSSALFPLVYMPFPALLPPVGSEDSLPEGRGQAVGGSSRAASPVGIRSDSNTCTSSWPVPTPLFESRSDGKYLIVLPP